MKPKRNLRVHLGARLPCPSSWAGPFSSTCEIGNPDTHLIGNPDTHLVSAPTSFRRLDLVSPNLIWGQRHQSLIFRVPRQAGKSEQPQKRLPGRGPRFAVRSTISSRIWVSAFVHRVCSDGRAGWSGGEDVWRWVRGQPVPDRQAWCLRVKTPFVRGVSRLRPAPLRP